MHIAQHQEAEVGEGRLYEFEVGFFGSFRIFREHLVELRLNAFEGRFVAAGDGDEYVLPLLLGLHPVVAVGIGLYDLDTVGNQYVGNAGAAAGDPAGDIGGCKAGLLDGDGFAAALVGEDNLAAPRGFIGIGGNLELENVVDEALGGDIGNPTLGFLADGGGYIGIRLGGDGYYLAFRLHWDGGFREQQGAFLLLRHFDHLGGLVRCEGDIGRPGIVGFVYSCRNSNCYVSCLAAPRCDCEPAFAGRCRPVKGGGESYLLDVSFIGKDNGFF